MQIREVSVEVPPALALDPDRASDFIAASVGEQIVVDLSLYNTGGPGVGLAVFLTGEAIHGDFIAPGMATAEWAALEDPLEAPFEHRRMQGEFMLEARLWDVPFEGAPPDNFVPAGLNIPPPFFYTNERERDFAADHWDDRAVEVVLEFNALKVGQCELEVWIVPPENPSEGVVLNLVLEIS
jgi:hypothetical protein